MNLLHGLLVDLGTYVALLCLFAAIVCYRANPVRAVNRQLVIFYITGTFWQSFVALGRVTHNYGFWIPLCQPFGGIFIFEIFLIHDACVAPQAHLFDRIRRNLLAWLAGAATILAVLLSPPTSSQPMVAATALRLLATAIFMIALVTVARRQRAARIVNASELLLFNVTVFSAVVIGALYLLTPVPIRSVVVSAGTLLYVAAVIALLLSERVFDVAGTAKVMAGRVVRFGVTLLLLAAELETVQAFAPAANTSVWLLALLIGLTVYPVVFIAGWVTHRFFVPPADREAIAREAILEILGATDSEAAIVQRIERLAQGYLGGVEVAASVFTSAPAVYGNDARLGLALYVREAWLSPESAVRSLRGPDLDRVLDWFTTERLGAVVRYTGRKASIFIHVGYRRGGTKPFTTDELEFLHELATVAGTSIDRLRAADENARGRRLALIGRLAADFSHSARNQISAIETLVEAVKDGREAELSGEYRRAVYEETLALAANHDLALEITRLDPAKLEIKPVPLDALLQSIADTYSRIADRARGRIYLTLPERGLVVNADERMLRQIALNLLRNSLQACAAVAVPPMVEVRARSEGDSVLVEVMDNGPGVPAEVHDRLFTPWATTKADGTGLGLAFCLEAMRTLGGSVEYLRPRGAEHAWFRLRLPRAAVQSSTARSGQSLQAASARVSE